jgi:hypothetical protein
MVEDWPGDLCRVPDAVIQKLSPPVVNELNYVWHHPDFTPRADGPQTVDEANDGFVTAVAEMMEAAPERARVQYQHTLAAISRMEASYKASNSSEKP